MNDAPPRPNYSRQTLLKEIGAAVQARLEGSRVLVVGAGGLGSPVLQYLAGAGVGCLGIVDDDVLDASNLHRQPLYALTDVGRPKVDLAAAAIRALNPEVRVEAVRARFTAQNARALVRGFDLVIDCSDNFRTKFLVNDAAVLEARPAVFASVYQYEGQLQVYRPHPDHACLRCLWPDASVDGIVGNCAEAGVLGPVPGVLGSLQALLAIKLLVGVPGQLAGELLLLDFTNFSSLRLKAPRHAPCIAPHCARIRGLSGPAPALEVRAKSLAQAAQLGFELVDIRTAAELAAHPSGLRHVPMAELLADPGLLDGPGPYLLVCASGKRSAAAAGELKQRGLDVSSLTGGLAGVET